MMMACPFQMINTPCVQIGHILLALAESGPFQTLHADGETVATVEDAECPEVVRREESAAVGLRNLVTQWHITQKGALPRILHLGSCLLHRWPGMAPLSLQCRRPGHLRAHDLRMWPVLLAKGELVLQPHILHGPRLSDVVQFVSCESPQKECLCRVQQLAEA